MKKPLLGAFENRNGAAHMLGPLQKIHHADASLFGERGS